MGLKGFVLDFPLLGNLKECSATTRLENCHFLPAKILRIIKRKTIYPRISCPANEG